MASEDAVWGYCNFFDSLRKAKVLIVLEMKLSKKSEQWLCDIIKAANLETLIKTASRCF